MFFTFSIEKKTRFILNDYPKGVVVADLTVVPAKDLAVEEWE